jgi:hypothetical protein
MNGIAFTRGVDGRIAVLGRFTKVLQNELLVQFIA